MKKTMMILGLALLACTAYAADEAVEVVEPLASEAVAEAGTGCDSVASGETPSVREPSLADMLGLDPVLEVEAPTSDVTTTGTCGQSYCTYTGRTKCFSSSMCSSALLLHRERACANYCVQWYDYVSTPFCC